MNRRFLFSILVLLGICLALVLSLFALNGHKWPHYFDNRVIADKSDPKKTGLPIFGSGFQVTQAIDLTWVNVSNPRLLEQPFCLSLMLSQGTVSPPAVTTFIEVALLADSQRWTWQTSTQSIGGGYTQYCTASDQALQSLVKAKEASIQVTGIGGASADNLAYIILAPANDALPVLINGEALEERLMPFKIDAHPSPTIVDIFKYAVLLLLAALIIFVMGVAAYRDWRNDKTLEHNALPHSK